MFFKGASNLIGETVFVLEGTGLFRDVSGCASYTDSTAPQAVMIDFNYTPIDEALVLFLAIFPRAA